MKRWYYHCYARITSVIKFILKSNPSFFQVQIPLFQNDTTRPMAQMIASMSGAMVNLLFIMLLGRVYENLALRLTTWGKLSSFISFENKGSGSFIPMQGRWSCNAPPDFRPTGCRLCPPHLQFALLLVPPPRFLDLPLTLPCLFFKSDQKFGRTENCYEEQNSTFE